MSRPCLPIDLRVSLVLSLLAAACGSTSDRGAMCVLNSDCRAPLICAAGVCSQQCREDRDCAAGQVCQPLGDSTVCVSADGAVRDAGETDAPPPDLGAIDAGATDTDAGLDAGSPDVDAGLDAGTVVVDAGFDAGLDAGPRDAGVDSAVFADGGTCPPAAAGTIVRVQTGLSFYTPSMAFSIHLTQPTCPGSTIVFGIVTTGTSVTPPPGFVQLATGATAGCSVFYYAYVDNPGGLSVFDWSETGGAGLEAVFSEWAGVATAPPGAGGSGASSMTTAIAGTAGTRAALAISLYCQATTATLTLTPSGTWSRGVDDRYTPTDPFRYAEDRIIGPVPTTLTEDPTSTVAAPWSWALVSFSPP